MGDTQHADAADVYDPRGQHLHCRDMQFGLSVSADNEQRLDTVRLG